MSETATLFEENASGKTPSQERALKRLREQTLLRTENHHEQLNSQRELKLFPLISPLSFQTYLEWQNEDGSPSLPHYRLVGRKVRLVGHVLNLYKTPAFDLSLEIWGVPESLLRTLPELCNHHNGRPPRVLKWKINFEDTNFCVSPCFELDTSHLPEQEHIICISPARISGRDILSRQFSFDYSKPLTLTGDGAPELSAPRNKIIYLDQTVSCGHIGGRACRFPQLRPCYSACHP